ncbi:Putative ubiquitin system component CUE [Septoria linicola]|uniref:Ubiquitin system component CUE n=1 Tax=Septoria linicola TaxID=215465 RepID=A0A9Q9EG73_9PEZI|nr:putative ubiquitin system component CUE [Septoria linicola]USW48629.1 Putative ubiquitin system component CUE [Septoria linicola]
MSSNQGYNSSYGAPQEGLPSSNPWADATSQQPQQSQQYGYQANQAPYDQTQQQSQQSYQPQQQSQQQQPYQQSSYDPPIGQPPRRAGTFEETAFVPDDQRGEQREALEHFEMNNTKPESQADRDVAQLSQEFPNIDSSLVAALYSDTQSVPAAREMLTELAANQ